MLKVTRSIPFYLWSWVHGISLRSKERLRGLFPSHKPTLYTSIHSLPLDIFITCICDGDLSGLVKKGKATAVLLSETWEVMLDEYLSAVSDTKDKFAMDLAKEIYLLQFNITRAASIQKYLFYRYKKEFADELINMGVVFTPYPDEAEKVIAWFNQVTGTLKRWFILLEQKKAELKKIQPESDTVITRKYFSDTLTSLSRFAGFNLIEKDITVGRYVALLQQCRDQVKKAEAEANKLKR